MTQADSNYLDPLFNGHSAGPSDVEHLKEAAPSRLDMPNPFAR